VHYLPDDPPDLVARKLLRVNLSDLAAMAARPLHYLLTTALPASLGEAWLESFAGGLGEDQRCYAVDLLGGDSVMTRGPAVLSLTAIGAAVPGTEVRRRGARPGDLIWVSGTIGDAFLGLQVLHICAASNTAAVVELAALPLSPAARALVAPEPAVRPQLAAGGDDYELLFTAPENATETIAALSARLGLPITPIGRIEPGAGVRLVDAEGRPVAVAAQGWRHF
jgi:thiamine-monophosphate kinase